jgi:DNA-binding CsgD family transcriptional regulator
MAVSNLVQAGATTEDIADKLLVTANVVKAYVAKARTSASESLIGMVVTNLLQTGASDEDIADTLAVSGDTVEGLISNLPLRINGEEEDSSGGRSKPVPPPVANTPVPAAPTAVPQVAPTPAAPTAVPQVAPTPAAPTAVPQVAPVPAPTPTVSPTPTAIRAAKLLPKTEDTEITESPMPAPELDSYSSSAKGRRLLGIIGIILSPLLLVAHSHAMRKRKQRA